MRIQLHSANPHETLSLGQEIGRHLPWGSVVGLDGPLAAGKTWMAKGIVQGIAPHYDPNLVKSPAYNLMHEYQVEHPISTVYHMDFYRLENLSDSDWLLFSEIFDRADGIHIIEWASRFLRELVPGYLSVTFSKPGPPACRNICVQGAGHASMYDDVLRRLMTHAHASS